MSTLAKLVIVPTPIGNLEDITIRALNSLKSCDVVFAEDTRTSGNLLRHFEIQKKMVAFHLNNEHKVLQQAIDTIQSVELAALVSDAGTPGISDPGFLLIRECIKQGIPVETLPGPTAFVPALVNSGLPCDRFYFEGFLPHKKGRETRLKFISQLEVSCVLYESPFRLVKLLEELIKHCGAERPVCVSRELTKLHEENFRGSLVQALTHFQAKAVKGEIVVVLGV
ncbi:MAG: 16S rRNA (cytidine(1402)-2'-O)-methyltransferase [Bacteroidia bacterium]|nr:16S rRNA (cytidine(1402)-2'-O)-methyltransferase [Bacteroidia bacterium]